MTTPAEVLAELRFFGQEMTKALDELAPRIEDPDLTVRIGRLRADHARHAQEIDDVFGQLGGWRCELPEETEREVLSVLARIETARRQEDIVNTLLDAERSDVARHEDAISMGLPEPADRMLRRHHDEEEAHVAYLSRHATSSAEGAGAAGPTTGGDVL